MGSRLARSNTLGPATVMLLASLGVAASADGAKASARQLAEELCGPQLAAFEAALGASPSVWQGPGATTELADWMSPASARIRVWSMSAFALLDPVTTARVAGRSPETRGEAIDHLRAGLAVTKCLTPSDADWRGAEFPEDATLMAEDETFLKEMRATKCFVELSENLLQVLESDLEGVALQDEIDEQIQVLKKPCETGE